MFSGSHWLCGWIVRFAICASTGFICSFSDDCGSHHKNADASPLEAVALCEGGADEIVIPTGQIARASSSKAVRTGRFMTSSVPSS
jgi:hypothetical protein